MADAKKSEDTSKGKVDKAAGKRSGKLGFFTMMILGGLAVPFIMPTLLLIFLGMLPTLIALVTDSDRQKSATIAIGSFNLAGVTPFIIDLWTKDQTMDHLFHILKEPSNWLIMLGAAGIGQLIIFAVPPVLSSLTMSRYETRLKLLKENLESLKTTWGSDVATTKSLDELGQKK